MGELKGNIGSVFLTLGPSGTNHEMVTQNYLSFRGFHDASVKLIDDFLVGLSMMAAGQADYMIQVAVHPDCADVVATAHFKYDIHVVDTFISPSKELGILTRRDVHNPQSIALQPATRKYADLDRWEKLVPVNSIMRIAEGLLEGKYDSGLTTLEIAEKHPGILRVDAYIGTVDDPWVVYGKRRVTAGNLVACPLCQEFVDSFLDRAR
ncbi:MAG: hypothetical protein CMM58_13070 [Rhodospirillaceae bacterium]|nr:hypothetical protein [Rhodospirillaceae bacterium]